MDTVLNRRAVDNSTLTYLKNIILYSDISLVCLLEGVCLILWGFVGILYRPSDLASFTYDLAFMPTLFWGFNTILLGLATLALVLARSPKGWALMLGTYQITCFTWFALTRGAASITSGITLNAVIVLVGILLVHRSGRLS